VHPPVLSGSASAENEFLAVAISADGWFHAHSINDEELLSTGSSVQTAVVHDGPEAVTFRVSITMQVPQRFDEATQTPSEHLVPLVITSLVRLRRGARVLDLEVTVDNTAEDHRRQMLLPADCAGATTWLAHQPFDFVERPVALDPRSASWQKMEQAEKPFLGIGSVGHGQRGLALLSDAGVHEGGVVDDSRRTLFATLFRPFRRTIATGGEPDGLEKGKLTFQFALLPFAGELPRTIALRELSRLQTGIISRQSGQRPSGDPPLQGTAAATRSFLQLVEGNLAVSAIKAPESRDGFILRL